MNEKDIRKYAELMQEFGLTRLEISADTIRLERSMPEARKETSVPSSPALSGALDAVCENQNYISVKSPIVGVFYAAPSENASPYVSVGDTIKKGQTLCFIEAMKLMNEITAENDGIISEICVANGQMVEFGTELFKIRR